MKFLRILSSLAIMLLVCDVVSAQPDKPGPFDLEAEANKMAREYQQQINQRPPENNPFLSKAISLLRNNPGMFGDLELIDSQKKEIYLLQQEYDSKFNDLENRTATGNEEEDRKTKRELTIANREYRVKLAEVLLPHQHELLMNCNIGSTGLPKLVTRSFITNALELTDQQKESIEKKSDALAQEIEEFVHAIRKKAQHVVLEELTGEQREKLNELVGEKNLQTYSSRVEVTTLFKQYLFSWDGHEGVSPIAKIFQTDLSTPPNPEK